MLDELEEAMDMGNYTPSDWEAQFIDSLNRKDEGHLTSNQKAKLNEIYETVIGV